MSDHHFWQSQFSVYLSFFVMYTKSRQSVKRSLIGQITCTCDNCQTGYQKFADKKTEYLLQPVIPVLLKTFWLAEDISLWVASLGFYFLFPLSLLWACDREDKKNQKAATIHEKCPHLNKENSHSTHNSLSLSHLGWQTMNQSRKIIRKQLMNQKTVTHPPPMKQRSKLSIASSKNG